MAKSFNYTVDPSLAIWSTVASSDSLSFSPDGSLIAYANQSEKRVWIVNADTGFEDGQISDQPSVLFSPHNSSLIIVQYLGIVQLFHRNASVSPIQWSQTGVNGYCSISSIAFNRAGTAFFLVDHGNLNQHDSGLARTNAQSLTGSTTSSLDCSPDGTTLVRGCKDGTVSRGDCSSATADIVFEQLIGAGTSEVSICAWSDDGLWVATGDIIGDVRLWDASNKKLITLSIQLPANSSPARINKLIFVPDNSGLIILSGPSVLVWDIGQQTYRSDIGLPSTATNISLDRSNTRIAVSTDSTVSVYTLKQITSDNTADINSVPVVDPNGNPGGRRDRRRKPKATNTVPNDLKEMDITLKVTKTEDSRFPGLFFDIYKGVMQVQADTIFDHAVAIKALRADIDPRATPEERQEFEKAVQEELKTWYNLTKNNSETKKIIVTFLGVTGAPEFGNYPAIVTTWMENGLLDEYIQRNKKNNTPVDELTFMENIADGISYLHDRDIIHGDIRASSILVDSYTNPRLADLGLLKVFEKSHLFKTTGSTGASRWKAPELLDASSSPISKATDVFAFTMTCWEIYSGKRPFDEIIEDFKAGLKITKNERPSRPDKVESEVWDLWQDGWNEDQGKRPIIADYIKRLEAIG